jgi:ABC-type branched-subunit amino acid transport system ATPase component
VSSKPTSLNGLTGLNGSRPAPGNSRLSVDGLVAGYGAVPVVQGMSLAADPGSLVAIIGPNGSGKSTFIKSVMGITKPTAGTVKLGDTFLHGCRCDQVVRAGIGYVPQVADVFVNLTVSENLDLGGYLHRDAREDRKQYVLGLFPLLSTRYSQRAGTLSGGERRLLALGRALMGFPSAILLDEPSAGLAPQMVKTLLTHLEMLRDEAITLVVVEQNVRSILSIADRAYVMVQGRSVLDGPAAEMASDLSRLGQIFMGQGTKNTSTSTTGKARKE